MKAATLTSTRTPEMGRDLTGGSSPSSSGGGARLGRILLVVSEAPPVMSGIARSTGHLRRGMEMAGYDVDVLSLEDVPRFCAGEVRISSMLWKGFGLLSRVRQHEIVHIHGPVPTFSDLSLLLMAIGRRSHGPLIVYTHHSEIDLHGWRRLCALYNWTHKTLARLSDHVIVETPAYAKELTQFLPAEKVSVVPCGTDQWLPRPEPRKAERFTVLFVGQLRPYKGIETLLTAVEGLEDVDVHIVGGGHREEHYRQLASSRELRHVTFHGRLSDEDLQSKYAEAHVVVLPSNTKAEAFGLVLLEGMVAGCVPVVSRLPGVLDVVGDVGLSFPVNDEAALRDGLCRLRDNVGLRQSLARRARERGRTFTWPRMVFWHRAVYERLLALRRFEQSLSRGEPRSALERLIADTLPALGAAAGHIKVSTGDTASKAIEASVDLSNRPGQTSSSLATPILARGGLLGVLTISSDADHQFNDYETQWLAGLAQRIGAILVRRGYVPHGTLPGEPRPSASPYRDRRRVPATREEVQAVHVA